MIRISLLGAALLSSAAQAAPPPRHAVTHASGVKALPVPLTDFDRAMAAARSDEHRTDQFATSAADPALIGKPFSFTLPAEQYSGAGRPTYRYEDGILTLDLETGYVRAPVSRGKVGLNMMHSVIIAEKHKMNGRYVGQNAFGATAQVTSFSGKSDALALVTQPTMMLSPSSADAGYSLLEGTNYWVRLKLDPAAARNVALDTDAVIEGTYGKIGSTDKVVGCEINGGSATIDLPVDSFDERCFIGANVTRVAFVRRSTREILKEWKQSATADGPLLWHQVRAGMNIYQLKSVEPTVSDDSYISIKDEEGHSVTIQTDPNHLVTEIEVNYGTSRNGRDLTRQFTAAYGSPLGSQCFGSGKIATCEGEWRAPGDLIVDLSILNQVTYRVAGSKRPVGVLSGLSD